MLPTTRPSGAGTAPLAAQCDEPTYPQVGLRRQAPLSCAGECGSVCAPARAQLLGTRKRVGLTEMLSRRLDAEKIFRNGGNN